MHTLVVYMYMYMYVIQAEYGMYNVLKKYIHVGLKIEWRLTDNQPFFEVP